MDTLFGVINRACDDVTDLSIRRGNFGNDRTQFSVLASVMSETGELAEEVAIQQGYSYKQAGEDGIVGEAIDTIVSLIDLIKLTSPEITEQQLIEIARRKCDKWLFKLASQPIDE